jgi:ribosomal protein L37E
MDEIPRKCRRCGSVYLGELGTTCPDCLMERTGKYRLFPDDMQLPR